MVKISGQLHHLDSLVRGSAKRGNQDNSMSLVANSQQLHLCYTTPMLMFYLATLKTQDYSIFGSSSRVV